MSKLISVIIPVLNEETTITTTLKQVHNLTGAKEIIVVDGGSQDKTVELATKLADKVCQTQAGRGHQMNVGAKEASGDILFFLHSDSQLETDALLAIGDALEDKRVIGGCFNFKINDDAWPLKFISWTSNLRAKYLNLIFGDQGIFVRADIFSQVGGYPEQELMEDWEFSRRLTKTEGKLVQLEPKIYTSARRWHESGIWKTIFLMHKIKFLYLLGVKPYKLREIYHDAR
ncbi:glycosyl transferase [Halobacteroides halobius DSM 5150]|uniref:4,4'-diaponeurosporenoate glycosyltransferase n=1 Tax=Halobacteroides halobius (strain ATCC 35273 / DSM 5150 / MD-1) TaxID=748449 RepID=L0K9T0_HALHC|nr:TIGR04283 family arsenosugar biosynthesis glycosyltransferase [Halobacteroides halobius]AGB41129.1 glycosyl transferase [Halobacteroides halobius DSM 5150]